MKLFETTAFYISYQDWNYQLFLIPHQDFIKQNLARTVKQSCSENTLRLERNFKEPLPILSRSSNSYSLKKNFLKNFFWVNQTCFGSFRTNCYCHFLVGHMLFLFLAPSCLDMPLACSNNTGLSLNCHLLSVGSDTAFQSGCCGFSSQGTLKGQRTLRSLSPMLVQSIIV